MGSLFSSVALLQISGNVLSQVLNQWRNGDLQEVPEAMYRSRARNFLVRIFLQQAC